MTRARWPKMLPSRSWTKTTVGVVTETQSFARVGMLVALLNGGLVFLILRQNQPAVASCWYALVVFSICLRARADKPLTATDPSQEAVIPRQMITGIGLAGLLWGSLGLAIPPAIGNPELLSIGIIVAGMMAGSAVAYSGLPLLASLFVLPCLLGMLGLVLRLGIAQHLVVAITLLL